MPFKVTERHNGFNFGCDPWLVSGTTQRDRTQTLDIVAIMGQINEERIIRQESWEKIKEKANDVINKSRSARAREAELARHKKILFSVERINEHHERVAEREIIVVASKVFKSIIGFFISLKNLFMSPYLFKNDRLQLNNIRDIRNIVL